MSKHSMLVLSVSAGALLSALSSVRGEQAGWFKDAAPAIQSSPLIADLNGDGRQEIAVVGLDDKLYIYDHTGELFNPGGSPWPKTLGFVHGSVSSVSAGDVDGDGALELVVFGDTPVETTVTGGSATLTVNSVVGGAPEGVNYVSFDNLPASNAGGSSGGITVSFTGAGSGFTGTTPGISAAPYISSSNGLPFGDTTSSGADPTCYLTTGNGTVVMDLPGYQRYFGLLWGSIDTGNKLRFYNGGSLIAELSGTDISTTPDGDQGVTGTHYVNITSNLPFNRVVAYNASPSFEFDNVSYNDSDPEVPDTPVATVKLYEIDGTLKQSKPLYSTTVQSTGKATPALFNCYKHLNSTTPHPGAEIILRDGNGRLHILYWDGDSLEPPPSTPSMETAADSLDRDLFGAQPLSPGTSIADLGSGVALLVAPSTNGSVYRWHLTSTTTTNWSVSAQSTISGEGAFVSSAALADLDVDGNLEIIAGGTDSKVYVWNSDGSERAGWPQSTTRPVVSSPAVADLDGDGELEIAIGCNDGGVYLFKSNGDTPAGWSSPAAMTLGEVFGSPIMAELDGQAGLEIVAGSHDGHLYAWSGSGGLLPQWPKQLDAPFYAGPAAGDIHGGGRMSVVAAGADGRLYVWDLPRKTLDAAAGWKQFRGGPARTGKQ